MEMSPELQNSIKTSLSLFMNEDEAGKFIDLSCAIDLVKQRQPPWQALVSIGVHAAELYAQETDIEKAILQELVGQALGPLEALLEPLVLELGEEPPENERYRMLFHTRFALGFLLLANGEKQRSKAILHEMVATKLSVRGIEVRSGPGIVSYTTDMAIGKRQSVLYLLSEYGPQEDYGELLYIMTEAAACNSWDTVVVNLAPAVLYHWAAKCDREDATHEYDFPTLEWLDLFAEAAEILSVCQEADSEGALPSECKPGSAQFLAWKFGQIVGRFAIPDNRWHDCPFDNLWELSDAVWDKDFYFQRGQEKTYQALKAVLGLLCEYALAGDWPKIKNQHVTMWKSSDSYRGIPLADISPYTDLYWAMKIGFVDKILSSITEQVAISKPQTEISPIIRDIQITKDIASTVALRQIKQQSVLDKMLERLPPSKGEIHRHLQQWLGPVWSKLPAKVVNTLVKAENYYRSEVNDDDAKVWFHKAVEASLHCCIVEPLVSFMQKRGDKQVALCFSPPRGMERKTSFELRKLSLWEWSDVLETLAAPAHKKLASLGVDYLKEFLKSHIGSRLPEFSSVSHSLRLVQQYRKGSAHYQKAVSRYDKEKWELEQMRNLVLGIDEPSVITQIFRLLGTKEQLQ